MYEKENRNIPGAKDASASWAPVVVIAVVVVAAVVIIERVVDVDEGTDIVLILLKLPSRMLDRYLGPTLNFATKSRVAKVDVGPRVAVRQSLLQLSYIWKDSRPSPAQCCPSFSRYRDGWRCHDCPCQAHKRWNTVILHGRELTMVDSWDKQKDGL